MAKVAKWIQFSPDNGGLVRVNVVETIGSGPTTRVLPGQDVDVHFEDLSADIQELVLDTFSTLAIELGATPAPITAVPQ